MKNADFFGKRIYAEVASLDKYYARETEGNERGFKKGDKGSAKGAKKVAHGNFDKFKKKKGERS